LSKPDELRAAIVAEARTWTGTPYRWCADIKGVGVDCLMLLVRVYQGVGLVPADFDPRPYNPRWHLHRSEELYLQGIERFAHRVERAQPGDIEVYRFGKTASHAGIVIDDELMIHSHAEHLNTELFERRTIEHRLDSAWSLIP
jgi:NlpC/P60 family putative phage cell wall peptidase